MTAETPTTPSGIRPQVPVEGGKMRRSEPPLKTVVYATGALIALGLWMTFPTFFQAFASD